MTPAGWHESLSIPFRKLQQELLQLLGVSGFDEEVIQALAARALHQHGSGQKARADFWFFFATPTAEVPDRCAGPIAAVQ
jgi:hypothetical protein